MIKCPLASKICLAWPKDKLSAGLLFISLVAIYGAGVYFIYSLTWSAIVFVLAISLITFRMLLPRLQENQSDNQESGSRVKKNYSDYIKYWPTFPYLFLWLISLIILHQASSNQSLISPWQVVPNKFFTFYLLASLSLIFILIKERFNRAIKIAALSAHYFLSFSVAIIVYQISYGFDPFIHQATMELIADKGLVEPKPFYYLGEYSLVVIAHKLSGLSIYIINKFLVPFLAAVFLPWGIMMLSRFQKTSWLKDLGEKHLYLSALFTLGISFSPFIITTPQSLSYLFLILAIIFGLGKKNIFWPLILSLAALAIHPLTGLPALGWLGFLVLQKYGYKLKKSYALLLKIAWLIGNVLIIPSALFFSGSNSLKEISLNYSHLASSWTNIFGKLSLAGTENAWLNTVYFFADNYPVWVLILIVAGIFIYYRFKLKWLYESLLLSSLSLMLAYLLTGLIDFNNIISYEQAGFANRILVLIVIFSLPFIILAINYLISLIEKAEWKERAIWLSAGLVWLSASLYFSYPRFDNYFNSRGYSTGVNDIKAVRLISEIAEKPYIVLANQQVSAAALKELGFDNYHSGPQGEVFFYPIPTGGALYQYYLDMVYKNPNRETMAKARNLAGVEESYLVINKYWHQSAQIIAEAKINADDWKTVGDEEIYIFKYSSEN